MSWWYNLSICRAGLPHNRIDFITTMKGSFIGDAGSAKQNLYRSKELDTRVVQHSAQKFSWLGRLRRLPCYQITSGEASWPKPLQMRIRVWLPKTSQPLSQCQYNVSRDYLMEVLLGRLVLIRSTGLLPHLPLHHLSALGDRTIGGASLPSQLVHHGGHTILVECNDFKLCHWWGTMFLSP